MTVTADDGTVQEVAQLIGREVRDTDLLGHTDKGTLALVLLDADFEHSDARHRPAGVAHRATTSSRPPLRIAVGAACYPTHAVDADSLRQAAEARAVRPAANARQRVQRLNEHRCTHDDSSLASTSACCGRGGRRLRQTEPSTATPRPATSGAAALPPARRTAPATPAARPRPPPTTGWARATSCGSRSTRTAALAVAAGPGPGNDTLFALARRDVHGPQRHHGRHRPRRRGRRHHPRPRRRAGHRQLRAGNDIAFLDFKDRIEDATARTRTARARSSSAHVPNRADSRAGGRARRSRRRTRSRASGTRRIPGAVRSNVPPPGMNAACTSVSEHSHHHHPLDHPALRRQDDPDARRKGRAPGLRTTEPRDGGSPRGRALAPLARWCTCRRTTSPPARAAGAPTTASARSSAGSPSSSSPP